MQTTSLNISEVLRRARDKSLTVPQFQRPFVWSESQVKLLIDSISRNYPIGSILLLTKSSAVSLSSRSIEATLRDGFPPDGALESPAENLQNEQHYVLDGQQRLTSIVRVFMNAHPKKTYYFDIKALVEEYADEGASWIISRTQTNKSPDRKDKNRLIRSDLVLDQTKADIYVSEYIEDSGDFGALGGNKNQLREAGARVKGIFERLRNYQLPVVTIDRDAQIESICRIFETINSTGTRLTTFDLAVARFFPKPDLRDWWDRARDKEPVLSEFDVDGERALQVISLLVANKGGKFPEATRGELLNLPPEVLTEHWDNACTALADAYRWAKQNGARPPNPPSHGVLTALAAMNAAAPDASKDVFSDHIAIVRKWYFCKILQQGARQAGNYKIGQDFTELMAFATKKSIPTYETVSLSSKAIARLYRGTDVRYRALQSLLAMCVQVDLLTGHPLANSEIEEHHIFPRAYLKRLGQRSDYTDSIANKAPIRKSTNGKLSDTPPIEYFARLRETAEQSGTLGQLQQRMEACLIPGSVTHNTWLDQFKGEHFLEFLNSRALLLEARLSTIIGEALQSSLRDDDADDL